MKHVRYLVILSILVLLAACKQHKMDFNNPNVKVFVSQLKTGTYQTKGPSGFVEVPRFTKSDIPELMKYVSDMSVIKEFPLPPNSTYIHAGKFRLGECVMWIIESIREGRSASGGCQLVRTVSYHGESLILSDKEMKMVADLYHKWWTSVQDPKSQVMKGSPYAHNPLDNTEYIWN